MKFTVILPTTGRDTLQAAIESVRSQSWDDWELVVVMDNYAFKVPKYGDSDYDYRISYTPTSGPSDYGARARNAGIERSSGEWIAYIDDDDIWHPNHLETHARLIVVSGKVDMVRTSGRQFKMGHKSPRSNKLVKKLGPINTDDILTVGMSHTRDIFNKTEGWQPCDNHDHKLWHDMLMAGGEAVSSDHVTFEFKR